MGDGGREDEKQRNARKSLGSGRRKRTDWPGARVCLTLQSTRSLHTANQSWTNDGTFIERECSARRWTKKNEEIKICEWFDLHCLSLLLVSNNMARLTAPIQSSARLLNPISIRRIDEPSERQNILCEVYASSNTSCSSSCTLLLLLLIGCYLNRSPETSLTASVESGFTIHEGQNNCLSKVTHVLPLLRSLLLS